MGYKGTPHVSLDIFNYQREKVCNLYDSAIKAKGQAYEIILTTEATGWKEIEFRLPFQVDKEYNHRWDSVKSEYLLRVSLGNKFDWFIIQSPNRSKDSKATTNKVYCAHISSLLKTKNLYLVLDDINGIGTIRELGSRILAGTGWSLGEVDTLYESDGKTEKVRSLLSEGKSGAHKLLTDLCSLFDAYPEFDGETKVVNLRSMNNKGPLREMMIGKDINSLSVKPNSSDLITRLYIEGEYGDDGYVGVDDVNPTGLTYILNFDYYKEIGLFTEVHQKAYDTYIERMSATVKSIRSTSKEITEKENQLNTLWGQPGYALYPVTSDLKLGDPIVSYAADQEDVDLKSGDDVYVLGADTYRKVNVGDTEQVSLVSGDQYVLKLFVPAAGLLGAKEAALDTKKQLVSNLTKDLNNTPSEEKKADIQDQIDKLVSEETDLVNGDGGISDMLSECVTIVIDLDSAYTSRETLLANQQNIEADFVLVVGDMLKDGYWQNNNYDVGQEKFLFDDGVEVLKSLSRPKVTYTFSRVSLAGQLGYEYMHYDINTQVRIYDKDLGINDIVYVSKTTRYLDDPQKDTAEVTNEDLAMTAQTLDSVLSRMTDIANLVEQRSSLYDRASAISKDGSIFIDRLNGQINILKNRLSSAVSSWYTDDRGNIIFENTNGRSAMMLTGDGFMIANGKTEDGNWNWRTFGTGEGFTADMIVAGFLSSDRIEAGSIMTRHLNSQVGSSLDISSNKALDLFATIDGSKPSGSVLTEGSIISIKDKQIDVASSGKVNLTGAELNMLGKGTVNVESGGSINMNGAKLNVNANSSVTVVAGGSVDIAGGSLSLASQSAMELASGATFNIKTGGIFTLESGNFAIDKDGNVELKGRIEAASGEIGGWVVDPGMLYSGSGANRVALSTGDATYAIWAGNETAASAPFRVSKTGAFVATSADITGKITSSSGAIGGWTVATGYLHSGSGSEGVYLSTADTTYRIWAGADAATNAPFRVGKDGSLYASDAEITGKITANDGQIGGWYIGDDLLYAGSGTNRVALSTGDATYAMWAGNETAANAPFRVTKDGKVYLTRVMALANETDTTPSELDLSNVAFWKLNRAVKTLEVNDNTLTIELYSGVSVNFKKASEFDSLHTTAAGSGSNNVTITVQALTELAEVLGSQVITATLDTSNKKVTLGAPGTSAHGAYVDCTAIYNSVTPSTPAVDQPSLASGSDILLNVPMTLKASNGATLEHTIVVNAADAYDRGEAIGYADGKDDGANSLTLSPSEGFTIGYSNSQKVTATTTKADGTKVTKSVTLSAPQSNYNTGWNACIDACEGTTELYRIAYDYRTQTMFDANGNALGTGFARVARVYNTYFIPDKI